MNDSLLFDPTVVEADKALLDAVRQAWPFIENPKPDDRVAYPTLSEFRAKVYAAQKRAGEVLDALTAAVDKEMPDA